MPFGRWSSNDWRTPQPGSSATTLSKPTSGDGPRPRGAPISGATKRRETAAPPCGASTGLDVLKQDFKDIVNQSAPLLNVLSDIRRSRATSANVAAVHSSSSYLGGGNHRHNGQRTASDGLLRSTGRLLQQWTPRVECPSVVESPSTEVLLSTSGSKLSLGHKGTMLSTSGSAACFHYSVPGIPSSDVSTCAGSWSLESIGTLSQAPGDEDEDKEDAGESYGADLDVTELATLNLPLNCISDLF